MTWALELFSCAGGMAEGFRRVGLQIDVAVDRDPDACASYEANLGRRPIRLDVHELLAGLRSGIRPAGFPTGRPRLLVADPPCTPWSRAGKRRGLADPRDCLAVTCDLIRLLCPRAYLIGNIPGLDDGVNQHVVHRTIGALAHHGYCVDEYARLDAASYGVPQHRHRPWWFGHLADPHLRWPTPTHGAPSATPTLPGMPALRPWVTCREALGHLALEELGRPVYKNVAGRDRHPPCTENELARTIRATGGRAGGTLVLNPRHLPASPASTIGAKQRGAQSASVEWPWNRPSTAVCAGIDKIAPAGEHAGQFGPNAIVLSERAAAILQGFPETWCFVGTTKKSRWSQIGQATPPGLAQAIAISVRAQMEATP